MPFCASVLRRTLLALLLALTAAPALACGPDSDCKVGDRIYRIRLPDGVEPGTPIGAVVFAHGYRGSAAGVMNNAQLGRAIADLGLALIAPEAAADDWSIANAPSHSTGAEVDEPEARPALELRRDPAERRRGQRPRVRCGAEGEPTAWGDAKLERPVAIRLLW